MGHNLPGLWHTVIVGLRQTDSPKAKPCPKVCFRSSCPFVNQKNDWDPWLFHPLMVTRLAKDANFTAINEAFVRKKLGSEAAFKEGRWSSFISYHANQFQIDAFELCARCGLQNDPEKYWWIAGSLFRKPRSIISAQMNGARSGPVTYPTARNAWTRLIGKHSCACRIGLKFGEALDTPQRRWACLGPARGPERKTLLLSSVGVRRGSIKSPYGGAPVLTSGIVSKANVIALWQNDLLVMPGKVEEVRTIKLRDFPAEAAEPQERLGQHGFWEARGTCLERPASAEGRYGPEFLFGISSSRNRIQDWRSNRARHPQHVR